MKRKNILLAFVSALALCLVLVACGGSSGPSTTTETVKDETQGYAVTVPTGYTRGDEAEAGKISLKWSDPDLWVNVYYQDKGDTSIDIATLSDYLKQEYSATIEETGDDYVVAKSTDADGDTNYTKVVNTPDKLIYVDVFYHPADESTMHDVALQIMKSLTY